MKTIFISLICLSLGTAPSWAKNSESSIRFEDFERIENPEHFSWYENFNLALATLISPSVLKKYIPIHVYAWEDDFCSIERSRFTIGTLGRLHGAVLDIKDGNITSAWSSPSAYCINFHWKKNPATGIPLDIALTYTAIGVSNTINGDYIFFEELWGIEQDVSAVLTKYAFMKSDSYVPADKKILNGLSFIEQGDDDKYYYKPSIAPLEFQIAESMKVFGNSAKSLLGTFSFSTTTPPRILISGNKNEILKKIGELWAHCRPEAKFDESSTCFDPDLLTNK